MEMESAETAECVSVSKIITQVTARLTAWTTALTEATAPKVESAYVSKVIVFVNN